MNSFRVIAWAALLTGAASAQWLTNKTPNVPRTADGKPSLTARSEERRVGKE